MSERRTKRSIIISADNNQCNCFGNIDQPQQLFLSKHKSLQIKNKTSLPQLVHLSEQEIPLKNLSKRSLRKNNSPNNYAMTSRTKDDHYNCIQTPPSKKQLATQEPFRLFNKNLEEKNYFTQQRRPKEQIPVNMMEQRTSGWIPVSNQNLYYAPAIPIAQPRIIVTHNQQPLRLTFSKSPPSFNYSPQLSSRSPIKVEKISPPPLPLPQPPKKIASLNDIKQEVVVHIKKQNRHEKQTSKQSQSRCNQEEIIEFQLTQDNIDSPRMMPISKKNQVELPKIKNMPKQQLTVEKQTLNEYSFGQNVKSRIVKPKSKSKNEKETYKSKIQAIKVEPTWKSLTDDTPRLRQGMKNLRQEKKSLKKIDDVEEIHSLGGSEKQEDDKESVVLGRLREYGSMLDPTMSLTTPTLGSKLISMNTQSSVGKSFLRSFQFHSEKNHYK